MLNLDVPARDAQHYVMHVQVATFELLTSLPDATPAQLQNAAPSQAAPLSSTAQQILAAAQR